MLGRPFPIGKNSFGAGLDEAGYAGGLPQIRQVGSAGPRKKRQGNSPGQARIAQEGATQSGPEAPAGVGRDGFEDGRGRLDPGRDLDQIHFRREAIVEDGLKNSDFGIEPQEQENPPAGGPGEINSFGESHFRKPASQVPISRPPHFRVHPGVGGQPSEVPPVEGSEEGERLVAGCSGMPPSCPTARRTC